jgi:sec-independent protein translocase protein TatA
MSMAFLSPSPMELMVIAVIALIVLGPSRLPEAARSLGKGMREMRDSFQGGGDDDDERGGSDRRSPDDPPDEPEDDGVDGDASFDELGDPGTDEPERVADRERVGAGERSS